MSSLHGFGLGIVSENAQGAVLDTFYPRPIAQVSDTLSYVLSGVSGRLDAAQLAALSKHWRQRRCRRGQTRDAAGHRAEQSGGDITGQQRTAELSRGGLPQASPHLS